MRKKVVNKIHFRERGVELHYISIYFSVSSLQNIGLENKVHVHTLNQWFPINTNKSSVYFRLLVTASGSKEWFYLNNSRV